MILHAAVCDQNGFQSLFPQQWGCIQDILPADCRLVIGKGNADVSSVAQSFRHIRQNVRGEIVRVCILQIRAAVGHGDFPVLAEGAVQIAAEAADRKNGTAGIKTAQRLLLNRIEGDRTHDPVQKRHVLPVPCPTCAAFAPAALRDCTVMRADPAHDSVFRHGAPPQSAAARFPSHAWRYRLFAGQWQSARQYCPRRPDWAAAVPFSRLC